MKKKEKTQLAQAASVQKKAQAEREARSAKRAAKGDKPVALFGWKQYATFTGEGYYSLQTEDTGDVPVRLFLSPRLFAEAEDVLYQQIVNATSFPGVKLVVITPDVHYGYGVPVGSVILTDGTLAMGPVGYDIGCGMVSARSNVPAEEATPEKRLAFNKAAMKRIAMGAGHSSKTPLSKVTEGEFNELIRGGAEYYIDKYGVLVDRSRAERNRIPVDDSWEIPKGGRGRPERGMTQLGSLGGGKIGCLPVTAM